MMMMMMMIWLLVQFSFISVGVQSVKILNEGISVIPIVWMKMTSNRVTVGTYRVLRNNDFVLKVDEGLICAAAHAKIIRRRSRPFTKLILLYDSSIQNLYDGGNLGLSVNGIKKQGNGIDNVLQPWRSQQLFYPPHTQSQCLQSFFHYVDQPDYMLKHFATAQIPPVYLVNQMDAEISGFCVGWVDDEEKRVVLGAATYTLFQPSDRLDECYACYLDNLMANGHRRSIILFIYAPFEAQLSFTVAQLTSQGLLTSTLLHTIPPEIRNYNTEVEWASLPQQEGLIIYPPYENLYSKNARHLLHKIMDKSTQKLTQHVEQLEHKLSTMHALGIPRTAPPLTDVYLVNEMDRTLIGFCVGMVEGKTEKVSVRKDHHIILHPSTRLDECYGCYLNDLMVNNEVKRSIILILYAPLEPSLPSVTAFNFTRTELLSSPTTAHATINRLPESNTYRTEVLWKDLTHREGSMIYPPSNNLRTARARTLLQKITAYLRR